MQRREPELKSVIEIRSELGEGETVSPVSQKRRRQKHREVMKVTEGSQHRLGFSKMRAGQLHRGGDWSDGESTKGLKKETYLF